MAESKYSALLAFIFFFLLSRSIFTCDDFFSLEIAENCVDNCHFAFAVKLFFLLITFQIDRLFSCYRRLFVVCLRPKRFYKVKEKLGFFIMKKAFIRDN